MLKSKAGIRLSMSLLTTLCPRGANAQLAERAARLGVPVVNVWLSSPVQEMLPGVFADFTPADVY